MQGQLRLLADLVCASPEAFELGRQWANTADQDTLEYMAVRTKDEVLFNIIHHSKPTDLRIIALRNQQIDKRILLAAARQSILATSARERSAALAILLPDHLDAIPEHLTQSEAREVGRFLTSIQFSQNEEQTSTAYTIMKLILPFIKAQTQETRRHLDNNLRYFAADASKTKECIALLTSCKNTEQTKLLISLTTYILHGQLGPTGQNLLSDIFTTFVTWSSDKGIAPLISDAWGTWMNAWTQGNVPLSKELLQPLWRVAPYQFTKYRRTVDVEKVLTVFLTGETFDLEDLDFYTAPVVLRAEFCVHGLDLAKITSLANSTQTDRYKCEALLGVLPLLEDPSVLVQSISPELLGNLLRRAPGQVVIEPNWQNTPVPVSTLYPSFEQRAAVLQLLQKLPTTEKTVSELTSLLPVFTGTWQELTTILLSNQK